MKSFARWGEIQFAMPKGNDSVKKSFYYWQNTKLTWKMLETVPVISGVVFCDKSPAQFP